MRMVVIAGLPCSGKSKLAERLRAVTRWPLLAKDTYKEILFDNLGHGDRPWSKRLSATAYALLFAHADELLHFGYPCLLEGNFRFEEQQQRFERLQTRGAEFLQVYCRADAETLVARFIQRSNAATRHPGHADRANLDELQHELRTVEQVPLPIGGEVVVCDTDGDWRTAVESAATEVQRRLAVVTSLPPAPG